MRQTLLVLLCAVVASAAPATRPAAPVKDQDLVRTWPGATYDYAFRNVAGKGLMKNERAKLDGRDLLKLTDLILIVAPDGRKLRLTAVTWCEPDGRLTPVRVTTSATSGDLAPGEEADTIDVTFGNGKASGTVRGKKVSIDAPGPLVTELTLFRLVTLLPRREGAELKFNGFQSTEGTFTGEQALRCTGQEKITIGRQTYQAWRFEHTSKGMRPSTYWVNRDGFFLKAVVDGAKEWTYAPQ